MYQVKSLKNAQTSTCSTRLKWVSSELTVVSSESNIVGGILGGEDGDGVVVVVVVVVAEIVVAGQSATRFSTRVVQLFTG